MKKIFFQFMICMLLFSSASYATILGTLRDNNTDTDGLPNTIQTGIFNAFIYGDGSVIQNQGIAKIDLTPYLGTTIISAQLNLFSSSSGGATELWGFGDGSQILTLGDWNAGITKLGDMPTSGDVSLDVTTFIQNIILAPTLNVAGLNLRQTQKSNGRTFNGITLDIVSAPVPTTVFIDIKPGSDPNCFNINGHGVVPVAILGSAEFDVNYIDVGTLRFAGLELRVRGNKWPLYSFEDVNGDGFTDMVSHFEDDPDMWAPGEGEADITGFLLDKTTEFKGTDSICVVP